MASPRKPRETLNRERILATALEIGDSDGVDTLTMRGLSERLGFGVMSLYNHVASKDDVLDGMLDLVLAEGAPPAAAGDWAVAIRASAVSVHDALRRHPWSTTLLMAPGHMRPARLRYMETLLARLRGAGFSASTTFSAYHVLDGYIFGFSLWEASHSYTAAQISMFRTKFEDLFSADEYPRLREHAQQHDSPGSHRKLLAFEFGLDLILDGLKKSKTRSRR